MATLTRAPAVPVTMHAAIIREDGPSSSLKVEEVATPRPGRDELLIRVSAVGLNHLDVFARQGLKGPGVHPIVLPHVSGVDVAGTIATGPRAGERVLVDPAIGCGACRQCRRGELSMCPNYTILGEHRWGGLAEFVTVPASNVIRIPESVPFIQAAAIPAAYTTAWRGIVTVGRIQPGERLLVVGASGGVGAPTWSNTLRALNMGGRMVICGATGGDRPDLSIRELYQHHRQILGAPMGNCQDFLEVSRLVFSGQLVPEV